MANLSYTQEYYLCAINAKGNMPALSGSEVGACLVAGGVLEMVEQGCLTRSEKGALLPASPLSENLSYLSPLYDRITSYRKPRDIKGIVEDFALSLSSKPLMALVASIGASLADAGCANALPPNRNGIVKYAPSPAAVTPVIEKIRAEFLEDGALTDETTILAAMLDHMGLIRNYFSKVESETMKARIKQVRKDEAAAPVKAILDYLDEIAARIAIIIAATAVH